MHGGAAVKQAIATATTATITTTKKSVVIMIYTERIHRLQQPDTKPTTIDLICNLSLARGSLGAGYGQSNNNKKKTK